MENPSIMYLVRITTNNTFSFSQRDYEVFNNLFYFFADAEIIPSTIRRDGDEASFTLEEQTRDVTFHNFTKDKIIRCLELIKERYEFNFDFSVEEIENTPFRRTPNSRRKPRGGKKSRRITRRSRNSKIKQKLH